MRGDFDSPLYRRAIPADLISSGVKLRRDEEYRQALLNSISLLREEKQKLRSALSNGYHELNIIRARDGVPYTHYGKSDVDENYFSSVVDSAREALEATK